MNFTRLQRNIIIVKLRDDIDPDHIYTINASIPANEWNPLIFQSLAFFYTPQ